MIINANDENNRKGFIIGTSVAHLKKYKKTVIQRAVDNELIPISTKGKTKEEIVKELMKQAKHIIDRN